MVLSTRFWVTVFCSWIVWIALDFLFHATQLAEMWKDVPAFKSDEELFRLIPLGYLSFLTLILMMGIVFHKVFPEKPEINKFYGFGTWFITLFALSYFLGLYSFVNIPTLTLIKMSLVYWIEMAVVIHLFYQGFYNYSPKKLILISLAIFLILLILSILLQNI